MNQSKYILKKNIFNQISYNIYNNPKLISSIDLINDINYNKEKDLILEELELEVPGENENIVSDNIDNEDNNFKNNIKFKKLFYNTQKHALLIVFYQFLYLQLSQLS